MITADTAQEFYTDGVALLRGVFAPDRVELLRAGMAGDHYPRLWGAD